MVSEDVLDELPGVIEEDEKLPVTPEGSPLTDRFTALEKVPLVAATVTVKVPDPPGAMVSAEGVIDKVKPGGALLAITTTVLCTCGAAE